MNIRMHWFLFGIPNFFIDIIPNFAEKEARRKQMK